MSKKKIIFFVIVISLIITVLIAMNLLDTTGDINQGNFRINDLVVNSYAKVDELDTNEKAENISDLTFNLSQNNKISILIAKNIDVSRIYLDNIKFVAPIKSGSLVLSQTGFEEEYDLNTKIESVEIYPEEKDDQYYIELNVDNVQFMNDVKAPENTKKITFDGTFLKDIDIKIEELQMSFECNLNIIDITGKKSVCSLKFKLPPEELLNNGISILRQDLSKYVFQLK
ncbi:MAG: hypothetical protein Q4D02_00530 [Clostridia bacterium]|nr:hypothetical protein [Clostridia bacterium]